MKPITLAAILAVTSSLCLHALATDSSDAQALAVVDSYVKDHTHWKRNDYRIERNRNEDNCIVFTVIYVPEEKLPMVGGGKSFEAFYDPSKHKVVKELRFQ